MLKSYPYDDRQRVEEILATLLESSAAEAAQHDALVLRVVGAFKGLLVQTEELGRLNASRAAEGEPGTGEPRDEEESGEGDALPPSSKKH